MSVFQLCSPFPSRRARAAGRDTYWHRGDLLVNPCELTAFVTAIANALANSLNDDELNLLGAVVTQLGDTLLTIAAQRSICGKNN